MAGTPTESNKCVLMFGAGFSVHAGLPVMRGFLERARRAYFAKYAGDSSEFIRQCYEDLLAFYQTCLGSAWLVNRDWENIEELYTQADLLRLCHNPDEAKSKQLCSSIAWTIWDVYRQPAESSSIPLASAIEQIRKAELEPAIITTNYDLVCELALRKNERERCPYYYPGFASDDRGGLLFAGSSGNRGIPILKLHGSVNWFSIPCFRMENKESVDHWVARTALTPAGSDESGSVPIDPNFSANGLSDWIKNRAMAHLESSGYSAKPERVTPAIIPPMLGKSSESRVIRKMWNTAIDLLRSARQIWIIGYSFPVTDAFMVRLLAEGLRDNHDLEFLAIVNIEPKERWQERLRDIFNPVRLDSRKVRYICLDAFKTLSTMQGELRSWFRESEKVSDRIYGSAQR
jgi:hypothetical protein